MLNMNALFLSVQRLMQRLSFFKSRSKLEIKVMESQILVWTDSSFNKEYP